MELYLHFAGGSSVPLDVLEGTIEDLNEIAIGVEIKELKRIRTSIPEIPYDVIENAVDLLRNKYYRYQLFRVSAATQGSLVLYISLTALAYWILDKTIAESVKESWKKTDLHKKIKDYFLKGRKEKLLEIEESINKEIKRPPINYHKRDYKLKVGMYARLDTKIFQLSVRIDYEDEKHKTSNDAPTYKDLEMDKDNKLF